MNWHSKTAEETGLMLNTDTAYGLSDSEAEKRLEEYGENTIESSKKKKGIIGRFFAQLNDIMIIYFLRLQRRPLEYHCLRERQTLPIP